MPLYAHKSAGGDYENPPEGTHLAVCYQIIDLGIQERGGQFAGLKHNVLLTWELVDEKMADGRPFAVTKEYTLSMNEKSNLYKDLTTWRGRAFTPEEEEKFDIFQVLGAPCYLTIIYKPPSDWPRVISVTRAPPGTKQETENPLVSFSFSDDSRLPESVPDWIRRKVQSAKAADWEALHAKEEQDPPFGAIDPAVAPEFDDEIPF